MPRNLEDISPPGRNWPEPDMSVLNAGRLPPPPMPGGLFGRSWSLLADIAAGTSTPIDYPAMAFLAACASLIGSKRRIRPFPGSDWSEPGILWCAIVGDPSSRKSPPLEVIVEPLRSIERDHADEHREALAQWTEADRVAAIVRAVWEDKVRKAVKEGNEAPEMPDEACSPTEPVRRRTVMMDTTPEAVAPILSGNPMGTLLFRDELSGWLMSFDRYAPSGREFWLEAYGGRPFTIDRKSMKDPIRIPFNGISVLGGIQPAKLARLLLNCEDDGLVARFLMVWPNKRPFVRPTRPAQMDKLKAIFQRLESLRFGQDQDGRETSVTIPLAEDAADAFEGWYARNDQADEESSGLMKSFIGKLGGAVLRLALVAELALWAETGGDEPREVALETLTAATDWVDTYARPMAEQVYGDAALPEVERNAAVLARYIVKMRFEELNKRELKRSPHKSALPKMQKAEVLDPAIERLVEAGWLAEDYIRHSDTSGQKRQTYSVNPAVHRDAWDKRDKRYE